MQVAKAMIDHTQDVVRREQGIKRTLYAFAIVVVGVTMVWLAFARYV